MGCCGNPKLEKKGLDSIPTLSVEAAKLVSSRLGTTLAPDERIQKRISICKACPHFAKELCYRCGCRVVAKVGKATESCPVHKW